MLAAGSGVYIVPAARGWGEHHTAQVQLVAEEGRTEPAGCGYSEPHKEGARRLAESRMNSSRHAIVLRRLV